MSSELENSAISEAATKSVHALRESQNLLLQGTEKTRHCWLNLKKSKPRLSKTRGNVGRD